jgi:hypothetical protein
VIKAAPATKAMNKAEATAITERIRKHIDAAWADITRAYEGKAWKAMGYSSWEAYVKAEFDMGRSRSYQLLDQGRVIQALREATGKVSTSVDVSEAAARELKPDLPAVTAEIRAKVEAGEDPKKAVDETVAARRAEKERQREERKAQQAEFDRQREEARAALPDEVKAQQTAKQQAIEARQKPQPANDGLSPEDRIAELEDAVRSLEAENARLKAENKKFGEMKAEWEKGGFEAVIAGKDAVIAAQASRIERESQEKVRNLNTSEMWRKRAEEAGWSNDVVIPLPGRAAHG